MSYPGNTSRPQYYVVSPQATAPPTTTTIPTMTTPAPAAVYGSPLYTTTYTSGIYPTPGIPQISTPPAIPASAHPISLCCPYCHRMVVTRIRSRVGLITWVSSLIGLIGAPLLCCLYPFCFTCTKDVEHSCPSCHHILALYQRL